MDSVAVETTIMAVIANISATNMLTLVARSSTFTTKIT